MVAGEYGNEYENENEYGNGNEGYFGELFEQPTKESMGWQE